MDKAMTPYIAAHTAYHREPPGIEWNEMLTQHFRNPSAFIISTPTVFIAARVISSTWTDASSLAPHLHDPHGDTLHIYVAAGELREITTLLPPHLRSQIKSFTFQRKGHRLHRLTTSRLIK